MHGPWLGANRTFYFGAAYDTSATVAVVDCTGGVKGPQVALALHGGFARATGVKVAMGGEVILAPPCTFSIANH